MAFFSIKPGVDISNLSEEMTLGMFKVIRAYFSMGYNCTITSGRDGKHMQGSLHYTGNALDFRTRNVFASDRNDLRRTIAADLGGEYDVVLERTHLHVEYDPK